MILVEVFESKDYTTHRLYKDAQFDKITTLDRDMKKNPEKYKDHDDPENIRSFTLWEEKDILSIKEEKTVKVEQRKVKI